MHDVMNLFLTQGKCGNCTAAMSESEHLNMVQVKRKAQWRFPVWGNLLTGEDTMALALMCDKCLEEHKPVMFCIEVRNNTILYHAIELLPTV